MRFLTILLMLLATPSFATQFVTKQIADKAITAIKIGSGAASSGQVCAADGSGGCAWGNQSGGSGTWVQEFTIESCNSSRTAFTISYSPTSSTAFHLYEDGLIMYQGATGDGEYTISGTNITLNSACETGVILYAIYTK